MRNVAMLWLLLGVSTKTMCQLYTDDVSDGSCTHITLATNFSSCVSVLLPQVFTINFASNALYRNYAESFLGRPAKHQAELDAQCYTFALVGTILIQQGYKKANIRSVVPWGLKLNAPITDPLGIGAFEIEETFAESPGSTTENQFVTVDQVVWCDTKHVLIVRCVNNTRQDWKLATINRNPEPWAKSLALDIIESLGMPRENALDYTGQNGGPRCPVAPNLFVYSLRAANRVGLTLPFGF